MIVRLVKLEIKVQHIEDFRQLTENEKTGILNFKGCSHLEIFQDTSNPHLFFTLSHWDSQDALDQYRKSDFFRGNWEKVKQWFSHKPEAWSLTTPGN